MYDKENNVIQRDFTAFSGNGWKRWDNNAPMVSFSMNDGYGGSAGHTLTIDETLEVIELLNSLIEEAKNSEDHDLSKWDETPF